MASTKVIKVLEKAVGLSSQLIKDFGPTLARKLEKIVDVTSGWNRSSQKVAEQLGKASKSVNQVGKEAQKTANAFKDLGAQAQFFGRYVGNSLKEAIRATPRLEGNLKEIGTNFKKIATNIAPVILGLKAIAKTAKTAMAGISKGAKSAGKALGNQLGKTLKSIATADLTSPLTSLFPIIGKSRAAFELLKGTIMGLQAATVGAVNAIEEGTRRATTSIVSQVEVVNTLTGEVVTDVADKIQLIEPRLKKLQEELIRRAPQLVGVTTRDVLDVFEQVSLQFGNLTSQLSAARAQELGLSNLIGADGAVDDFAVAQKLTERLAASLKNAGLTARDTAQEVRAILTGDIDFNARLAKRLNLSRAEFELAKSRGDLAGLILERTESIEGANEVYNTSLTNTLSVIQDIAASFGRVVGREVFEQAEDSLLEFRQKLEDNRKLIEDIGSTIGSTVAPILDTVIFQINELFDYFVDNEETVTDILTTIVKGFGDSVVIITNGTKAVLQFGVELVKMGEKASDSFDKLRKLNPKNWFKEEEAEKLQNSFDFQKPIDGIINLKKEIGETGPLQKFANLINSRSIVGPLSNLLNGDYFKELEKQADNSLDGIRTNIDRTNQKFSEIEEGLKKAIESGDSSQIDALTNSLIRAGEEGAEGILAFANSLKEQRDALNFSFKDLTKEQYAQLDNLNSQVAELELIEAKVFAQIPAYRKIKDESGAIVADQILSNFKLLESAKTESERREITEKIVKDYDKIRDSVEDASQNIKTQLDLQKSQGDTVSIAASNAKSAIDNLTNAGKNSQEVFDNLKKAVEAIKFSFDVGADVENIGKFYRDLQANIERLDGDKRKQAIQLILSLEDDVAKAKSSQLKASEKLIELEEERGRITAAEATVRRGELQSQQKFIELLATENKIVAQRLALGSKTASKEKEILTQISTASKAERDRLFIKLEQLRAEESFAGAQLTSLMATRDQQAAELLIQDSKNVTLGLEAAITEEIRKQNELISQQEVEDIAQTLQLTLSGLSEANKELAVIAKDIDQAEQRKAAIAEQRLLVEKEIAKIVEQTTDISEAKVQEIQQKRRDLAKEELQTALEISQLRGEEAAKQVELRIEALDKQKEADDLAAEFLIASQQASTVIKQNAIDIAASFNSIELAELNFKVDNVSEVSALLEKFEKSPPPAFARPEAAKAVRQLKQEFGDILKSEKALFNAQQRANQLELEQLKLQNQQRVLEAQANLDSLKASEDVVGVEKQRLALILEQNIAKLEQNKIINQGLRDQGAINEGEFSSRSSGIDDQIDKLKNKKKATLELSEAEKKARKEAIKFAEAQLEIAIKTGKSQIEIQKLRNAVDSLKNSYGQLSSEANSAAESLSNANTRDIKSIGNESRIRMDRNLLNSLSNDVQKSYKDALDFLGDEGTKTFNKVFKEVQADLESNFFTRSFNQIRGVNFETFSKNQNLAFERAVDAVVKESEKQRRQGNKAEQQRQQLLSSSQRQEQLQQQAADQARNRLQALQNLISEARQNRLEQLAEQQNILQAQIDTKNSIEEGFRASTTSSADIFDLSKAIVDTFGGSAEENVAENQAFAALEQAFGEKVANALRGTIEVDEKILEQLKNGTASSDELTKNNKIFLDPSTGQLIVSGKDPDFEKLTQIFEFEAQRKLEEEGVSLLQSIEENTRLDNARIIAQAADRGTAGGIGTSDSDLGVLYNNAGEAVGVVNLSETSEAELARLIQQNNENNLRILSDIVAGNQNIDPRREDFLQRLDQDILPILAQNTKTVADIEAGRQAEGEILTVQQRIDAIEAQQAAAELKNLSRETGLTVAALERFKKSLESGFEAFDPSFQRKITNIETADPNTIRAGDLRNLNSLTVAAPSAPSVRSNISPQSVAPSFLSAPPVGFTQSAQPGGNFQSLSTRVFDPLNRNSTNIVVNNYPSSPGSNRTFNTLSK